MDSTAEKTHPRVTTDQQTWKRETLYFVHNKNGSVTHRSYFERVGDLNPENLAPINLANISHQKKLEEDFKHGFKEKRRFF